MDNPVIAAYLPRMFARAVTMLAILAVALVTTLTPAHAARMSVVPDQAMHMTDMMQAAHDNVASCDGDQDCGSVGAGMCGFTCTGLSVFLPSPGGVVGDGFLPASHDRPLEKLLVGLAPGLNERPPQLRLL